MIESRLLVDASVADAGRRSHNHLPDVHGSKPVSRSFPITHLRRFVERLARVRSHVLFTIITTSPIPDIISFLRRTVLELSLKKIVKITDFVKTW